MKEIKEVLAKIKEPRHASYMKYPLADIPVVIMCGALSGLDTPGDLVIYAKSKGNYLREEPEIENIPSKAAFGCILSMIDGKQTVEVILEILCQRFGTDGKVIAVDGKRIVDVRGRCSEETNCYISSQDNTPR